MYERCGKLPITLLLQSMCQLITHWYITSRLCMTQTARHNSHFLTVCTVANCRQHRAAENRLRHRVLHKTPSFPWADPSLFCINANYIILSGMQIRLDEAMADHLYRSVSYCFQIRKNGTFQHTDFDISVLFIKSAFNLWGNRLTPSLKVHYHSSIIYIPSVPSNMTIATMKPRILKPSSRKDTICIRLS